MFTSFFGSLQQPEQDVDKEAEDAARSPNRDSGGVFGAASLWHVAAAVTSTVTSSVKQTAGDLVRSVQETDWQAELTAFGREAQSEAVHVGSRTAQFVQHLPAELEKLPEKAQQSLPTIQRSAAQAAHSLEAGALAGTFSSFGRSLITGTREIVEQVKHSIESEISTVTSKEPKQRSSRTARSSGARAGSSAGGSSGSSRQSRFDVEVAAMQRDSSTYCDEPPEVEDFAAWRRGFDLAARAADVEAITASNAFMAELQARIVPLLVSHEDFWTRYFFRLHKLQLKDQERQQRQQQPAQTAGDDTAAAATTKEASQPAATTAAAAAGANAFEAAGTGPTAAASTAAQPSESRATPAELSAAVAPVLPSSTAPVAKDADAPLARRPSAPSGGSTSQSHVEPHASSLQDPTGAGSTAGAAVAARALSGGGAAANVPLQAPRSSSADAAVAAPAPSSYQPPQPDASVSTVMPSPTPPPQIPLAVETGAEVGRKLSQDGSSVSTPVRLEAESGPDSLAEGVSSETASDGSGNRDWTLLNSKQRAAAAAPGGLAGAADHGVLEPLPVVHEQSSASPPSDVPPVSAGTAPARSDEAAGGAPSAVPTTAATATKVSAADEDDDDFGRDVKIGEADESDVDEDWGNWD